MNFIFLFCVSQLSALISLQEFPPTSKLDPSLYGDQNSKITEDHIEKNLEGYNVYQVMVLPWFFAEEFISHTHTV